MAELMPVPEVAAGATEVVVSDSATFQLTATDKDGEESRWLN